MKYLSEMHKGIFKDFINYFLKKVPCNLISFTKCQMFMILVKLIYNTIVHGLNFDIYPVFS